MGLRSLRKHLPSTLLVVDAVVRVVALLTVPRRLRPTTAMAWLLAIFVAPLPGSVIYNIFGSSKLPKDRRDKQREANALILDATASLETGSPTMVEPEWLRSVVTLNRTLGAMPLVSGNQIGVLPDYAPAIAAMTEAVTGAQEYVHVEFYILTRDDSTSRFFDALNAAHDRGVEVRVLFDSWATMRNPNGSATRQWLQDHEIPYQQMLPVKLRRRPDLRNHRKILVIDGLTAFTGSQNMVDATYNVPGNIRRGLRWKDLMIRIDGPAALGLDALFLTDWYSETGELLPARAKPVNAKPGPGRYDCQIVPSGPGFEGENNLRLFNALVYGAQRRLTITSPYFVPDDSMLYAITTAAQRGVAVDLFACAVADQYLVYHAQRSYYETLLRAGVRIFLYEEPTVLHAKHFTVDDDVAVVGSSNMDVRSFSLNLEVSVMVRGAGFVAELRTIEADYRSRSREVTLDEWLTRPPLSQMLDTVARLTAALQ